MQFLNFASGLAMPGNEPLVWLKSWAPCQEYNRNTAAILDIPTPRPKELTFHSGKI